MNNLKQISFPLNNEFDKDIIKDCLHIYFNVVLQADTIYLSQINILSDGILKTVSRVQLHSNSILDEDNLVNVIYDSTTNIEKYLDEEIFIDELVIIYSESSEGLIESRFSTIDPSFYSDVIEMNHKRNIKYNEANIYYMEILPILMVKDIIKNVFNSFYYNLSNSIDLENTELSITMSVNTNNIMSNDENIIKLSPSYGVDHFNGDYKNSLLDYFINNYNNIENVFNVSEIIILFKVIK